MKISHIEHLGIAVKSIEEALPYYENVLGLKCYNIETVEDQKVKTAFLKVGDVNLQAPKALSQSSLKKIMATVVCIIWLLQWKMVWQMR